MTVDAITYICSIQLNHSFSETYFVNHANALWLSIERTKIQRKEKNTCSSFDSKNRQDVQDLLFTYVYTFQISLLMNTNGAYSNRWYSVSPDLITFESLDHDRLPK